MEERERQEILELGDLGESQPVWGSMKFKRFRDLEKIQEFRSETGDFWSELRKLFNCKSI